MSITNNQTFVKFFLFNFSKRDYFYLQLFIYGMCMHGKPEAGRAAAQKAQATYMRLTQKEHEKQKLEFKFLHHCRRFSHGRR